MSKNYKTLEKIPEGSIKIIPSDNKNLYSVKISPSWFCNLINSVKSEKKITDSLKTATSSLLKLKYAANHMSIDFKNPKWRYTVPDTDDIHLSSNEKQENAKQKIYDFYFLESIDPDLVDKSESLESPETVRIIIDNLRQARNDLIESIKRDYVEDLRYSVSCELRHVWDGHCTLPSGWLDEKVKTTTEIAQSDKEKVENQIKQIQNAINSLEQIDTFSIPSLGKTKEQQIQALKDYLDNLEGTASSEGTINSYVKSLAKRFVTGHEHSWTVAKKPKGGEEPNWQKEWKIEQLDQMARFLLGASPQEWSVIQEKVAQLKKRLSSHANSSFKFNDRRDTRYTWSSGTEAIPIGDAYFQTYLKAYEVGLTNRELALVATSAFIDGKWNGSFGGPNWATIAKTFGLIDDLCSGVGENAKMLGERSGEIAIDQAHNLQHNTGSAFNKAYNIYGEGHLFETALNFKADPSTTTSDLLGKSSSQLSDIGSFYLSHSGQPPLNLKDEIDNLSKILKNKEKIGQLCLFLTDTQFDSQQLEILSYCDPIDWRCLAKNKYFAEKSRQLFIKLVQRNYRFKKNFQTKRDLDSVYEAYYSSQQFTNSEIDELIADIDLPSMDQLFHQMMHHQSPSQSIFSGSKEKNAT